MEKKIADLLYAKSGKAISTIARDFFLIEVGEVIPTVIELEKKYPDFSHGTIQNAIKSLREIHAIETQARGNQGTLLINKDNSVLLNIMGFDSIVGCMPLPYSKRYEGLATGLTASVERQYNIASQLVFVRGAINRIAMLLSDRYDYAIVSKLAAKHIIKEHNNITIVKELGEGSYASDHVIVFNQPGIKEIQSGMKVGVDYSSVDQAVLTEKIVDGKDVKLVNSSYSNVLKKVMIGEVDCAVWNKDEIYDKYIDVNYCEIDKNKDDTIAVIVINKEKEYLIPIIERLIDVSIVIKSQSMVIDGLIFPTY